MELLAQTVRLGQRVLRVSKASRVIKAIPEIPDPPGLLVRPEQRVLLVQPEQLGHKVQLEHLQLSRRQYKTNPPITQFRQLTNLR